MLELAEHLVAWREQGRDFAVATVVAVSGSAPRQPGAAMAVDAGGEAIGSVSGGCVEAAVYELCREALATGRCTLRRFGFSDEDAYAEGLSCGGTIEVFVQPFPAGAARAPGRPAVGTVPGGTAAGLARVVAGAEELVGGTLVAGEPDAASGLPAELAERIRDAVRDRWLAGHTGTVRVDPCDPGLTVFVESRLPPPRLLVFGAVDFAAALASIGRFLGYHVTVCDARPVFSTRARFPDADEVVVDWPHRYLESQQLDARAVVCVLTHDAKFDVPLLLRALRLPLAYVGAMGSRRTHLQRLELLREAGATPAELAGLHSPIGLDLGARTPEETALSIAAEIVAHGQGRSGEPLSRGSGPVHPRFRQPAPPHFVAGG